MILKVKGLKETQKLANDFAASLNGGEVVLLNGDLGAGKTTFTQFVFKALGVKEVVSSPTFALVNEYRGGGKSLYHFDMYRISGWDDLYSTGYFDYLDLGASLIIEWSENIEAILPEDCIRVTITKTDDFNERKIDISGDELIENTCG